MRSTGHETSMMASTFQCTSDIPTLSYHQTQASPSSWLDQGLVSRPSEVSCKRGRSKRRRARMLDPLYCSTVVEGETRIGCIKTNGRYVQASSFSTFVFFFSLEQRIITDALNLDI